jgi:hypothetical protein
MIRRRLRTARVRRIRHMTYARGVPKRGRKAAVYQVQKYRPSYSSEPLTDLNQPSPLASQP